MTNLFPFKPAVPEGLEWTVLLLFIVLGVILFLNSLAGTRGRYALPAAVHIAAGILAVLAGDLMTLLVAWEALTFSAFFLIRGEGATQGRRISLRYLGIHVTAAVFFFFALLIQYRATGSLMTTILVPRAQPFMVVAVMIKTATMPIHFWLTEAYPSVHPAITPLLSVFTTKVGVLTAARLVWVSPGGYPVLAWLGAITAVGAVIFALLQHNARKLLSYHIVSQVGYMVAGIGLAAGFSGGATTAGVFHLVTHTLYKALLLLVAAQAIHSFRHEDLTRMGGLGARRPLLLLCGIIGAAAISGVPFTSGYASKYLLKEAAQAQPIVLYLLNIASVGTGLSFIKFTSLIFFNQARRPDSPQPMAPQSVPSPPAGPPPVSIVPLVLVAGITLGIGFFPGSLPGVPHRAYFAPASLLAALYPLVGSVVLWMILRDRLTRPEHAARPGTSIAGRFIRATAKVRMCARHVHEQDPQMQVLLILLVLLASVGILRLL